MDAYERTERTWLDALFHGGALSHAYIVYGDGDETGGAAAAADALASAMLCGSAGAKPCGRCADCRKTAAGAHPDVIYVDKPADKKDMPVDKIRDVIRDTAVLPNEAAGKVYIFRRAEDIKPAGQNMLLKMLEEPPPHVSFILVAGAPDHLLPTVKSRCVALDAAAMTAPAGASEKANKAARELFEALGAGALAFVGFMYTLEKLDKAVFAEFLSAARARAAAILRERAADPPEARDAAWRALRALRLAADYQQFNVSPIHITGLLCAELMPRK
jgi:DNA polymerase-3 subunit delta'